MESSPDVKEVDEEVDGEIDRGGRAMRLTLSQAHA